MMTPAQKRFCEEYMIDLNATRAYKIAYPSCKKDETANANSSRLLRNDKVKEYIEIKQKELEEKSGVTQQRIIDELAKIAFADIRKAYDGNGNLKSIQDIDDETAGAIVGIESFEEYEGRGEDREYIGDTKKIKMADKIRAAELLGKHLGMFKEKIEISKSSEDTIKEIDEYVKKKDGANE